MSKKVLITVGGTGGHVFPAMSLAKKLLQDEPDIHLLFVGGGLSKNRYFARESFPFKEVSCGSLSLSKPLMALRNAARILKGIWQSYRIMKKFKPDLVVGFGSYYTLPALLAAKTCAIPIVLHEANRLPGKVNRLMSKYVALTGVFFPDTANRLKGKSLEVAIPLREGYRLGSTSKEQAKTYFQLDPKNLTLLVFGGSQGAKAMNRLASEAIIKLNQSNLQVLHFTGDAESALCLQEEYTAHGIKATVKAFETRMDMAWQAADVVISRSGAGTIAEEIEFEVPGILIPFPYATDNHQESNADFMVDKVNGAVKCLEKELDASRLAKAILSVLNDRKQLKEAIRQYKIQTKPLDLCAIVCEMAEKRSPL